MSLSKKKSVKATFTKSKNNKVVKSTKAKKASKPITTKKKVVAKKTTPKKQVIKKQPIKKIAVKVKKIAVKKTIKKATTKKVVKSAVKKVIKKAIAKQIKKSAKKVVAKKTIVKKTIAPKKRTLEPKTFIDKKEIKEKTLAIVQIPKTEKLVKIGIKTRKQLIAIPPQPIIEVSNHPKTKIKTLLISQPKPENDKNAFYDLSTKYNLIETFRQFIKIEGLPVKDFRNQRIDILEHKAVILTSRLAVDHYFRMCNEMRVTVPETMKYFCINEATAYYLQKYIQYRKRKIFFGHQTIRDLVDVIKKNKEEKFLLPASDIHKEQICDFLDAIGIQYTKAIMYRTVSANLQDIKLIDYDLLAVFTPAGVNSIKQNFPNFKQGNTRIACFGSATAEELKKHGYRLDIYAPNSKNPSMSGAIDDYLKEANKR